MQCLVYAGLLDLSPSVSSLSRLSKSAGVVMTGSCHLDRFDPLNLATATPEFQRLLACLLSRNADGRHVVGSLDLFETLNVAASATQKVKPVK